MKNQSKQFNLKKACYSVLAIFILVLLISSCTNDNSGASTANSFSDLKKNALKSITQNFHFIAGTGYVSFTSVKGVKISFNSDNLTLNGNSVTSGLIDVKFVEIFSGGNMLTTGMHTMGLMPDGNHAMMNSGGEFYINVTKNGQQLELSTTVRLMFSSELTDNVGGNPNMTLWNFAEEDSVWVEEEPQTNGEGGLFLGTEIETGGNEQYYYAYLNHFGWTNVDCFYDDPRPKTSILATVPAGYNNQNCSIYLHYDGQGNALAILDEYDSTTGLFSEHYGQIPIGLVCHIIFATEDNGKWRYAIKATTIAAGDIYNFTTAETTVGTQTQMIAAIDALP